MTTAAATTRALPTYTAPTGAAATISVIDPMNRTGKITIPLALVDETRGLADHFLQQQGYQTQGPRDLSLCLLFQNGRCNAADRCNQIHASSALVHDLRARAAAGNCCAAHGDVQSGSYMQDAAATVIVFDATGAEEVMPLSSFARTSALDAALHKARQFGAAARINRSRACRLHQARRCKFGQDCKNVHMCNGAGKDAKPQFQAAPVATPLPMAVSARRMMMPTFVELRKTSSSSSLMSSGYDHLPTGERTPSDDCNELSIRSNAPPLLCADLLEASTHAKRSGAAREPLALTDLWSTEFCKLQHGEKSDISLFANALAECDPSPLMSC